MMGFWSRSMKRSCGESAVAEHQAQEDSVHQDGRHEEASQGLGRGGEEARRGSGVQFIRSRALQPLTVGPSSGERPPGR